MNSVFKLFWGISVIVFFVLLFYAHSIMNGMITQELDADKSMISYTSKDTYFYVMLGIFLFVNFFGLGIIKLISLVPYNISRSRFSGFWLSTRDHFEKFKDLIARIFWSLTIFMNVIVVLGHIMIFDHNSNAYEAPVDYYRTLVVWSLIFFLGMAVLVARLFYKRLDVVEVTRYSGER